MVELRRDDRVVVGGVTKRRSPLSLLLYLDSLYLLAGKIAAVDDAGLGIVAGGIRRYLEFTPRCGVFTAGD